MKKSKNEWTLVDYVQVKQHENHQPFIDSGKIIAGFLAVLLTALSALKYYEWPIDSINMVALTWLHIIGTACVPLFLLCTGYLMIYKPVTFRYYYQLLYFLINYWCLGLFIRLTECIIEGKTFHLWQSIVDIFNYSVSPYAWYIELYIGLYLLIPLLNHMWNYSRQQQEHVLILIVFFTLCCVPSIVNVYDKIFPTYFQSMYPIFYYFLGAYYRTDIDGTKREADFLRRGPAMVFGISLISLIQNVMLLYDVKFEERIFNQYFSYPACFIAIGIFLMCKKYRHNLKLVKINKYVNKFVLWIVVGSSVVSIPVFNWLNEKSHISSLNVFVVLGAAITVFILATILYSVMYYILIKFILRKRKE